MAAPRVNMVDRCPMAEPLEKLSKKNVSFGKAGVLQGKGDIE